MPITKYLKGSCQLCGGRIEFPAEAVGTEIECPHCGKATELMLELPPDQPTIPLSTILWTSSTILMLFLGLAGGWLALKRAEKQVRTKPAASVTSAEQAQSNKPFPESLAQPEVVIKAGFRPSPVTLQKNSGSSLIYAVGTLTNAAARQRFGVKVVLDLFDDAGNKVGEATDYQQVIEPGSPWNFRALAVVPKTASASIASVQEER
jgi:hypothetical protein